MNNFIIFYKRQFLECPSLGALAHSLPIKQTAVSAQAGARTHTHTVALLAVDVLIG